MSPIHRTTLENILVAVSLQQMDIREATAAISQLFTDSPSDPPVDPYYQDMMDHGALQL